MRSKLFGDLFRGCAFFTARQGCAATRLAAFNMDRSASFTAALFGKAFASSGSSTTMFEEAAARAAYLPRTNPPGKSERLYSLRSVSFGVELAFFIEFPFRSGTRPGADKSDRIAVVGVGNGEKAALL